MMMINLEVDSFVFNQQSNHGIMDDIKNQDYHPINDTVSSTSSSEVSSVVSSEEEEEEEDSDSSTTSLSAQVAPQTSGPLQDMSSLLQDLPFKRGLSTHYNGKSQSFTSLANVKCLEDLAKPENPCNKKLKSSESYGGFLDSHGNGSSNNLVAAARSNSSSRLISKNKASRGSCSSLCVNRNSSFLGNNKPPIPPPHRSTSTSNFTSQTSLFALGV